MGRSTWKHNRKLQVLAGAKINKAKVKTELQLAREVQDNNMFYKYVGQKRKTKDILGPLFNSHDKLNRRYKECGAAQQLLY